MNVNNYVGKPYVEDSFDCYGLVKLVYKEDLGIDLPAYFYLGSNHQQSVQCAIEVGSKDSLWESTNIIQEYDLLFFRINGYICHVGIAVDGNNFIHNFPGRNVTYESLNAISWKNRFAFALRFSCGDGSRSIHKGAVSSV